tara:strand:+ start:361 stop:801 length:441 start_codon:yes stop_codon:yes gene_type:complete
MYNFEELEALAAQWHHARNLIHGSRDHIQYEKLQEECQELALNIENSQSVVDDIGDIIVVLINIAERNHLTLTDCLEHAYNDIKDRKGTMVNGIFVKERIDQSVPVSHSNADYIKGFGVGSGKSFSEPTSYEKGLKAGLLYAHGGK